MLKSLFKPRPAQTAGRALFSAAVAQARSPALYTQMRVPDTHEGRFEIYSLHVYLVLARLKDEGEQAAETAQACFDAYIQSLDDALRDIGVGDLSVGKKMRKLGEAFYGRIRSCESAMAALPDRTPLEAMLVRTVYAGLSAGEPQPLADYLLGQRAALGAQPLEGLLAGEAAWSAL
jgi:cytochrome b pre-mRNA-processing protein 3